MVSKAQRIKAIVKNPEPARGKSGTDPLDPWGAKAGIAEASEEQLLRAYLKSRGINPDYVPRDTKIAHSKSSAYLSWRKNHEFHEAVDKEDTLTFDIPLMIRMLELAREDVKDDMELHRITERLISIRSKGVLTMDDYEFIAGMKKLKEEIEEIAEKMKDPCWKGYQMVGMKDKGGKKVPNCVPEEKELKEWTLWDKIAQARSEIWRVQQLKMNEAKQTALQTFRTAAAEREKKHNDIEKARQEKLHQDPSKVSVPQANTKKDDMSSAIDRLEKHLNKESVEQIDEISKETLASYRDKAMASNKNAKKNRDAAEPGKDMSKGFADLHAKSNAIVKKRIKGLSGYLQRKHGMKPGYEDQRKQTAENTLDPKAATEAPVGPGECGCSETSDKKKQLTKSARMIKNLYKKKNMKEETYDWEKDDKAQQTKGVKIEVPKKEASFGENKPEARIVMSGGKTMTGEKRDTVEIDPLMAKRNNTPDQFEKPNKK